MEETSRCGILGRYSSWNQRRISVLSNKIELNYSCIVKVERLKKDEEKRVLRNHDRTGTPVEGTLHIVQEVGHLENRDDANKFNLAMDDENIDFNISGVPNAMVKRSQSIIIHNLIQQIENHLQRQAHQSDLQQHRAFNPFSKESKDAIMAVGNSELCEIIDVEPKSQCRACLTHWSTGIVYCTCGQSCER